MNAEEIDAYLEKRKPKPRLRSVVFGVGSNDSTFAVSGMIDGRPESHRGYKAWTQMIMRCYNPTYLNKKSSYRDAYVCNDWMMFTPFLEWWRQAYIDGYHLDKDLLITGNKIYRPEACVYIPPDLNTFTADNRSVRGEHPIGVCWHKGDSRFQSEVMGPGGKRIHLGRFKTALEAHEAWFEKKIELAQRFKPICETIHPKLFEGLISKINSMRVTST